MNQILNMIVIVHFCVTNIKDVAGFFDAVSRAWKCANPGEIKNNGTSCITLISKVQGCLDTYMSGSLFRPRPNMGVYIVVVYQPCVSTEDMKIFWDVYRPSYFLSIFLPFFDLFDSIILYFFFWHFFFVLIYFHFLSPLPFYLFVSSFL